MSHHQSWDDLRKEARTLENEIDMKLVSYSKLSSAFGKANNSGSSKGDERTGLLSSTIHVSDTMHDDIDRLLQRLQGVNQGMSEHIQGLGPATGAQLMHTLQRHREILRDYAKEFRKTKANIETCREHAELLSSVREDIDQYKNNLSSNQNTLLRERNHLMSADRSIDDTLGQAASLREQLHSQANMFSNITGKVSLLANRFPAVNSLIMNIQKKKMKDMIILALVVSGCFIFLIMYMIYT